MERRSLPGVMPKVQTLAVLPFRNLTDDPAGTRFIADGLAEALATNLAQTERLCVLPWVTTQRVEAGSLPLAGLARQLNARRLLVGTMRSTPQGLTVSLSIVDGAGGTQTWSRQFEGTAEQLPLARGSTGRVRRPLGSCRPRRKPTTRCGTIICGNLKPGRA